MTLARTISSRFTRSLWWTSTAMVLSLAPAAAQSLGWIRQLGTSGGDVAYAAAPDGSGGAYVSGLTDGSLGGPNAGARDAWLARFDSSGNRLWIRQPGSSGNDHALAAAPDGAGGAYVGGDTDGSLGGPNAGDYDVWLARYDGVGNQLWIRQLGSSALDFAYAAAPDGSGGVYVSGTTFGTLGGPYAGSGDAWLARYDSAGNQLWIRQFGSSTGDGAHASAPDSSGGVYTSGLTFGVLGASAVGGGDAWLARYDDAGNQLWIRQLGSSSYDEAWAAAPDGAGGVYLGGKTQGSFGGPYAGSDDAWLARYDDAGNPIWVRQLGTSSPDVARAAAPDGSGGVYVSGVTSGSLGGPKLGLADAWLAHYDSAGGQLWIGQYGTNRDDIGYAAAPSGPGRVYLCGSTTGSFGGPYGGGGDAWLARFEAVCGTSSSYCTPKVNSALCLPTIAASGSPSASAGSGFTINTSNVLDNKFGLYFYGKSGPNNAPFQGGLLCMQPPLVRTMIQDSGGGPPCGGAYQIDFNTYIASGKDPGLVAGQQVWIQTWSRDPGFAPPDNTSLSDAVTFTLCP